MQDAERRDLPALRPLLEALARSTSALRSADWNVDATGERRPTRRPRMPAEPRARLRSWRARCRARELDRRSRHRALPRSASPSAIRRSTPSSPCWPTRRSRRREQADRGDRARPLPRSAARRADLAQGPHRPRAARRRPRPRACATDTSPPATRPSSARLRDGGRRLRRQDQPPRVRARHDQRGLGVRPGAASARSEPLAGRLVRRLGRVGPGRHGLRVDRHRHRRLGSHSVGGVRPRRTEADARRDSRSTASSR